MNGKEIIGIFPELDDAACMVTDTSPIDSVSRENIVSSGKIDTDGKSKSANTHNDTRILRAAGGVIWEDPSLADWNPKDFRIFVGDLGREVTDELLYSTFVENFPSTTKAKVVKDKHTGRSKGFGFVSISDESEFKMAMKSMHGKYIGSRPVKLKKSNWSDRNLDAAEVKTFRKAGYKIIKKH